MSSIEVIGLRACKGEFIDEFIYKDGRVEVFRGHNIIVNSFLTLIACLVRNPTSSSPLYWANGIGDVSWDSNPPVENAGTIKLVNEIFRKQISFEDISFLDANGNVTATPTNKIQIAKMFEYHESNGDLREFGIFGYNASSTVNSGIMINHKIHGRRSKDSSIRLSRTIKFTFA